MSDREFRARIIVGRILGWAIVVAAIAVSIFAWRHLYTQAIVWLLVIVALLNSSSANTAKLLIAGVEEELAKLRKDRR